MDLIVKICGLSSEETVDAALDCGADMVGLVVFPPSPRSVSPATAARLAARARGRAEVVVLTVDMAEAATAALVETVAPDWLQLHGGETPAFVASAKKRFGTRVMKAVGVSDAADLKSAERYTAVADRLLLDAKPPKGARVPGGRGERFDWQLLKDFDPGLPIMLSGGLNAENVAEAIATTQANAVDVSSGVETAPGRKDADLIRDFIAAARHAAASVAGSPIVNRVA